MPNVNVDYTLNSNHLRPNIYVNHDVSHGIITQFMPGSVTATAHHVPQVVVTANGQRSACYDNCDYKWAASHTMTFDDLTTDSATIARGDDITVEFDVKSYTGTLDDIAIYISGAISVCDPSSITGGGSVKSITCQAGDVPISNGHTVEIVIPQLGSASRTVDGLSSVSVVTSNEPTSGSRNGGTIVTVQGSGFTPGETVIVSLGGSDTQCDSTGFDVTYDTLICKSAANNNLPSGRTPVISGISMDIFNVAGGEEFTITGNKFEKQAVCDENGYVMVGDNKAEIVSWTNAKIVAKSPAASSPGQSDVFVYVCNKGNSNTMSATTTLEITSVSGTYSSLMGGRQLTINGAGFSGNGELAVSVGDIACDIVSASATQVVVKTGEYTANTVPIQLKARSLLDASGNDASDITIEQGQMIEWSWQISLSGVTPSVQVQEVANKGDATGSTMWSEAILGNSGTFRRHMKTKGVFHYSGGLIDGATTFASGTIRVVDAVDKPMKVKLTVNGVEADHIGSSDNTQPALADCVFMKATGVVSNAGPGHYVTYSWGSTPVLDRFKIMDSAANGFNETRYPAFSDVRVWLNIANGFSASSCSDPARITVGDFTCNVNSQDAAYFGCTLNGEGMDVNAQHGIGVEIVGMGKALFDDQQANIDETGENHYYTYDADMIDFAAFATSISPNKISRLGGAVIIITGSGFVDPTVYFQVDGAGAHFPCAVSTNDYTSITCKLAKITTSANTADQSLVGTVVVDGTSFQVDASLSSLEDNTPTVTAIKPQAVSTAGEIITIQGVKLTDLEVSIGRNACSIVSSSAAEVKCNMPDVPSGKYNVKLHGKFGAVVMEPAFVQVDMGVSNVGPTTSGLNGGARVTIDGFGFDEDVVVAVRDVNGYLLCEFCHKVDVSSTQIVFETPRSSLTGDGSITITHEYLTTTIAAVPLTYSDDSSTVIASTESNLVGGESVSVDGTFNDCASTVVQVELVKDPCAAGAHTCHHRAQCTPTDDGLDYTCACIQNPDDVTFGFGNGHECYWFIKKNGPDNEYEGLENWCETNAGWDSTTFDIDSVAKEEAFKQWLIITENFNSRGTFVKYYGVWSCVKNENVDGVHQMVVMGQNSADCAAEGKADKKVHCERGVQGRRNCADEVYSGGEGKGKFDYFGRTGHTLSGMKCMPWTDTTYMENYGHNFLQNSENWCRNPWDSNLGPFCALEQKLYNGDLQLAPCGIPECSELTDGSRETCLIKAMGSVEPRANTENDDPTWQAYDEVVEYCYWGNTHQDRVQNPRRCYNNQRFGNVYAIRPVDVQTRTYQLVKKQWGSDNHDTEKYVFADIGNLENGIKQVNFDEITDVSTTHFVLEDDAFMDGASAIRFGEYYVSAGEPWSGNESGYIQLIHQDNISELPAEQLSFKFECASDNFGMYIEQPAKQNTRMMELTPTSCSVSSVSVDLPSMPAGSYKLTIYDSAGRAQGAVDLDYKLSFDSVSPAKVGTGGGVAITLSGSGFTADTVATVCAEPLQYVSHTSGDVEEIVFVTNPIDLSACPSPQLVLTDNDESDGSVVSSANGARNGGFEIDNLLTPSVTGVSPTRGGTAGGTDITINGSGFGNDAATLEVSIHGSECTVSSVSDTEIICQTSSFDRSIAQEPVAPVVNVLGGPGLAVVDAGVEFWYIDRWSSPYTWGCDDDSCKPQAGEIIVIPAGQVILLDESTPKLAVLLIDGGSMIWDRQDGIELHMEYGIINNGGHFEVGTEEDPFCAGNALIKLYGHQRSINLPIYGAKVFAVRFGTFSMYGCPKTTTWTELEQTAEAGESQITLTHPVHEDWFVGNEIIIAATGDVTNFHRSEKRTIGAVSVDGKTLTLTEPLDHRHMAVCSNGPGNNGLGFGWAGELCMRAEVGLLTRNIKLTGDKNHLSELEDCALGAGTVSAGRSISGVQTCFQNRYGHETGSDQFGGILFLHKPDYAHIAYAEFTHAGQAFNLARYPIHFHTPGSLPTSYVRGCAIHNTFNRALTMHGVHNLTVEYNVIYNVMGLAFFLEDAVEEDNILRYNLGIMNKKSSSLLNIDSTPAVYWIPNPNNIFYGNRAAGSTHFGFWFNPPEDGPTGPSAKDPKYENFCVKNRPLGAFFNNTAHSMGMYGMWVFTDLTPTVNGACDDTQPKAIKFGEIPETLPGTNEIIPSADRETMHGFFAWHCLRGAEVATGGAMHFINFIASNNWVSGLAWKETFLKVYALDDKEEEGSMYKRSIVIGHIDGDSELAACGDMGIETPWKEFSFTVDDIAFYNYDEPTPELASANLGELPTASEFPERRCVAIDPCYGSNAFDCGAITYYKNVRWDNCARRTSFEWEHEAVMWDIDGTLLGQGANTYVVPKSEAFDPARCSDDLTGKYDLNGEARHPAQICEGETNGEQLKFHRFMFNKAQPQSMEGTMAVFENQFGVTKSGFRNCRPRGEGWMVLLQGNQEYKMHFELHEDVSNITFEGDIDDFEQGEWLTIRHDLPERVDSASLTKPKMGINHTLLEGAWPADPLTLDTYTYNIVEDNAPYSVRYTFNGQSNTEKPQIDDFGGSYTYGQDFFIMPEFYKCFYKDCIVPEPAPPTAPPTPAQCNYLDCMNATTSDYDNLSVSNGQHMVIDSAAVAAVNGHFKFGSVFIEGVLEISADAVSSGEELTIEADHFVINTGAYSSDSLGRRERRDTVYINQAALIIGTESEPIPCDVKINVIINGDKYATPFGALPGSIPIGSKAIGGIGNVIMHGCKRSRWWTTLADQMNEGDDSIKVADSVSDWAVGDEIAVASTDYQHRHTEYFSITAISGKTLSLNASAEWRHMGDTSETLLGRTYSQAAEVVLLSRNIKLDGTGGSEMKHGARVLLTSYTEEANGHFYVRQGAGQFSGVEFKGFGQYGYDRYDDMRSQILFYGVDANANETTGQLQSYVNDCSFHNGFHSAVVALFESHNLEVRNNIMFKLVNSAIKTDANGLTIDGNVIGNVFNNALYMDYFYTTVNANFADDEMPAGVDTEGTEDVIITNNRVAGVDGSAFAGAGEACDQSEVCTDVTSASAWSGNIGHSCLRGYYILRVGRECNKVSGFTFFKMRHTGVLFYTNPPVKFNILDDTIVADSQLGVGAVMVGANSILHQVGEASATIKNSVIIGKGENTYDCIYDEDQRKNKTADKPMARQRPPLPQMTGDSAAFVISEFPAEETGFPACAHFELDIDVAIRGKTCVLGTTITDFNGRCGSNDHVVTSNHENVDHSFKMDFVSGNSIARVDDTMKIKFHRPLTDLVNTADCVDLHCDGLKRMIISDGDGGVLGSAGTLIAESEYEWDGVERDGVTYADTRDGLGDYRIPSPMKTDLDGSEIPIDQVRSNFGVVRDDTCSYDANAPGWFCPAATGLQYYDLVYEMMDEDHFRRRLTPLAVRSDGYVDIINGPGDHSCCIGYACSLRMMTIHSTISCGKDFEYFFSSTLPIEAKFHLPDAPENCKIKVALYTKRPNRVDLEMDGVFVPATNAAVNEDGSVTWSKPDDSFIPAIDSHDAGSNYQQRDQQLVHMILSGGHSYTIKTVQTLVLELSVTTELTEDDFYDNGNLANNLAALLGIDPSRIRVMDVISESSARRGRRHAEERWITYGSRTRRSGPSTALQIEVLPEVTGNHGADALDEVAKQVIESPAALASAVTETLVELDPTIEADAAVAVAAPPKEPPTPEEPVTLAQQLGVEEITPADDLEDFITKLNDAAGMDITTLETAESKAQAEQEEADKAADLIVYDTPTTLILDANSVPTIPQLLEQRMFVTIGLSMNDQIGRKMDTVGYVNDPYQVKVDLVDPVLSGVGPTPSIDGDTVMEFVPGNGQAVFNNLILRGDLIRTKLRFSVKHPADTGIAPVTTPEIDFMPAIEEGECEISEGGGFDRKVTMTDECDYVCLTPCNDLLNSGAESEIGPQCYDAESACDASVFATCDNGCHCDLDSIDLNSLKATDFMSTICTEQNIEVRVNKCVMNKLGLTLNDLYINGPEKTDDYSDLETSLNNNCRGQLSFLNGPEYAFKLDRTFSDCKTQKGTEGNMATYKNAIQASADVVDANGINSRKRDLFLEFGCKFEADLTQATNIGELGSTWAQDPGSS